MNYKYLFATLICLSLAMATGVADSSKDNKRAKVANNWPQLVGVDGQDAANSIKSERPELNVVVVPEDAMVTMDHRVDRVRVFVNSEGKVVTPPRVG